MINIAARPFKSNGVFYDVGSVIDPSSVRLFKNKVSDGKIVQVNEHNLDQVALRILNRRGVDIKPIVENELGNTDAVAKAKAAEEYRLKVVAAAEKYGVDMTGKTLEQVVTEVRAIRDQK